MLKQVDEEANAGPFKFNWDSLKGYQIPDWYKDAKFGFSFTGACIRLPRLIASGIRETCTWRAIRILSTMSDSITKFG